MSTESYRMEFKNRTLAFISAKPGERLEALGRAFREAGAEAIGPQAYSFQQGEAVRELVASAAGDLDAGECIYILNARDGALDCSMLVPPRTTGGVGIQRDPED